MLKAYQVRNLIKSAATNSLGYTSRSINTSSRRLQSIEPNYVEPKEVRIEVPWGYVASKWYGPENVRPILMLHGWQDNAGTFDRLIPLLPKQHAYLAIDLPGHGLSSKLPAGMYYGIMNYISVLNLIQQHYKWKQLSFCSHSMGAQISSMFASLYPDRCDLLIGLDALMRPSFGSMEAKIKNVQRMGDMLTVFAKNEGKEPPTYTYDEIVDRWSQQTKMSPEAIKHLMKRGICESAVDPNRFYFSRDIRLKFMDFASTTDNEIFFKLLSSITAPHLFIRATKSQFFDGKDRYQKVLDILIASNPKFEWVSVKGGHHSHLSDPALFRHHITNFINKYRPAFN